jgi:hypothetical protein
MMQCFADAEQFGISTEIIRPSNAMKQVKSSDQACGSKPDQIQYRIIGARFILLDFSNPSTGLTQAFW